MRKSRGVVVVVLLALCVGLGSSVADKFLPCDSLPLSDLFWLASYDDENPRNEGNFAQIVDGTDEYGKYYGMEWTSPADTDLTIGELGRFDRSGITAIKLTLAAEEPIRVLPAVQVNGDYCGRTWRFATADIIRVGEEAQEYVFSVVELTGDPFQRCAGELPDDGLERLYSIILFPEDRAGELRVYEVSFCDWPLEDLYSTTESIREEAPEVLEIPGLEAVGSPWRDRYPEEGGWAAARSIWDLQAWDGKLYLGGGDSAENAGPVDVIYYDPATGVFASEFTVDDEEIEKYRIIDGWLYIPGHDAMEPWELGNIYVNDGSGWTKLRTIPKAVHVYDIAKIDDELIAVGAQIFEDGAGYYGGGAFFFSQDAGHTWTTQFTPATHYSGSDVYNPLQPDSVRFTELFEFKGRLYASGWLMPTLYVYDSGRFVFVDVSPFPGATSEDGIPCADVPQVASDYVDDLMSDDEWYDAFDHYAQCITARITNHGILDGQLVYIGGTFYRDHGWRAFGLFAADQLVEGHVRQLGGFDDGEPRDLLTANGQLLLLTTSSVNDAFQSRVHVTDDLDEWTQVAEFTADAPAYSIEILDEYLYIGLGGDHPGSGNIYRIALSDLQ